MADPKSIEDVSFWRNKAEEFEREFEDFRESSQMLEKELEASLEQAERTIRELRLKNNSLQLENEAMKDKYDVLQRATETQISEMEEEANQRHKREEEYVKYIRELEQKNDDLERSQRAMYTSLGEFETKLNYALERNVLLESELDEKESLKTMVQRLKDEARDLKQEIQVREKQTTNDKSLIVDSNKMESSDLIVNSNCLNNTPTKNINSTNCLLNQPNRISAMNIVGDLLRKVGALESKLASCRGSSRDSISPSVGDLAVRDNQYRSRRLNRGTSTPSIHNLARS
ncbi:unnamed protein product [Nezara viridula]|uniref:NUDE domain-containing protein n=1 Tax=Nezara viridula TaxID=85310 RepID=A0A9P0MMY6_NEZVI|nr:unnamed protein product [Nezara viridula]